MKKSVFILLGVVVLAGCRTTQTKKDYSKLRSVGLDYRPVEQGFSGYSYEMNNFSAFRLAINPNDAYVDRITNVRTDFAKFRRDGSETECVAGLTTTQIDFLAKQRSVIFTLQPSTPGMMKGAYQSQLRFNYKVDNGANIDQFLMVCTNPVDPVKMSDLALVISDFIRCDAAMTDVPTYDVCCRCKADIYRDDNTRKETLLLKDQIRTFLMLESNDGICKLTLANAQSSPLRPGDAGFRLHESRFYRLTYCEETMLDECDGQYMDSIDGVLKAEKKIDLLDAKQQVVN